MRVNALRVLTLVLTFVVAGWGLHAKPAFADAAYADGVSPVYLVVSIPDDFDVTSVPGLEQPISEVGSQTIVVLIGTFTSGDSILDTRFATNGLTRIPLPDGLSFRSLDGNQVTIFGGVLLQGTTTVHMMSPSPDPIPQSVQVALLNASRDGVIDALVAPVDGVPQFPRTYAIAEAVAAYLPAPPEGQDQISVTTVEQYLFATPNRLTLTDNGTLAVASEGELFPHEPGSPKLFDFRIGFDEDANFSSDVCLSVAIDVKPNSSTNPVNRTAQGKLPVAILSSDHFDATAFADATITVGGVAPTHVAIEDVDGDGLDDLICQFPIPDLAAAGVLDVGDTSLELEAVLDDGSCIRGTDVVEVLTN